MYTQKQKDVYIYIYVCKDTHQKFPPDSVKYIKSHSVSQQALITPQGICMCMGVGSHLGLIISERK